VESKFIYAILYFFFKLGLEDALGFEDCVAVKEGYRVGGGGRVGGGAREGFHPFTSGLSASTDVRRNRTTIDRIMAAGHSIGQR